MANTAPLLSYNNTFGDWLIATNILVKENNDLAANNYFKPTGTLYLNSPTLGLQVANNAIIAGTLQVQGIGSGSYVQNNLRVDGQAYFQNTTLGLTNAGMAIIQGELIAEGSGTGLAVSNNAIVGGNVIIARALTAGNTTINGTMNVANNTAFTTAVSPLSIGFLYSSIWHSVQYPFTPFK